MSGWFWKLVKWAIIAGYVTAGIAACAAVWEGHDTTFAGGLAACAGIVAGLAWFAGMVGWAIVEQHK